MYQACQADKAFGPSVGSCRGGFDFTLVFEDSILGLVPQAALLLLAPIRLATLRKRRNRVAQRSHLGFCKTLIGAGYVVSSLVLLAIWSEIDSFKTNLSIAAASLEFVASLFIVSLSHFEHGKAVRPSHLLQFFLLVLFLCDAVRLRTLFLMDYPTSVVTTVSVHTCLTGLLLLLESLNKRQLFQSDGDRRLPPEETIGLFGKRLFWYLNALFKQGYRKILKPADLYDMDADLASKERSARFGEVWRRQDKKGAMPLIRTIVNVLWVDLLLPVLPRCIQVATTLSQPYLITAMIDFINDRNDPDSLNKGYGLIAAFALNYAALAISSSWCAQSMARLLTKLRACLISSLYEQTVQTVSKDVDLGSATVLMNVDVEKFLTGCKHIHEVWATLLSAGIAMYILYTHLGVAFVAPFLTILISTALSSTLGAGMKLRQLAYAAATERRVTAISYVVGNMKGVRMLGLSETVLSMLTNLREIEITAMVHIRKLLIWLTLLSNVTFQLTTVATYVTFAVILLLKHSDETLDINKLYGSLSALKLFTTPLMMMLQVLPQLQISYASLERIESFLKGETIVQEQLTEPSSASSIEDTEMVTFNTSKDDGMNMITLNRANFAIDGQSLLFDLTARCPSGTFTMIVGKVGSGKSILLRSIVGETELTNGRFQRSSSGIAFCDQQVWLRNATIRANIVGEVAFDEVWYRKVLWSCGLFQDLHEMKHGDLTSIGSKGAALSGGQKNRLCLARALYARKPLLVIDDMLAGLDSTTEKLVFDRVFSRTGLLRKSDCTIILATHATHYARYADQIVVVSDGRILEKGSYQELSQSNVDFQELSHGAKSEADSIVPTDESDSSSEQHQLLLPDESTNTGEDEDAARQSGDRQSLVFFIKAVGAFHMTVSCVTLAGGIVLTQIQYLWLKWWAEDSDKSRKGTIRQLYLFIIVTFVNIVAYLIYFAHFALWFMPRVSRNMHATQLVALLRARFSSLLSMDIGSVTNRFSQDIMLVDLQLQGAWLNVTFELLVTICSIAILTVATPPVAATIPIMAAVGYCIQRVYLRTSRQVRLMDLEAKAPLCTHFIETMAGIVTVRAFGWVSAYRKRNDVLLDQSQVPFYLLAAIQNWLTLVLELMVAGLITLIVGLAVGLRDKIDPGYLGLALISAMDLGFNFRIIIVYWTELETSLSAVARIRQFASTPAEETSAANTDPPSTWPQQSSVVFDSLSASYTADGKSVLQNIDLSIAAGEKIGLCGRTGSGKSSLVATLFGLLHQQGGRILVDGVVTTDVALSVLRSKIVALPQEPFFLKGNVRYNLAPWHADAKRPAVSDAQMEHALREVQLWEKLCGAAGETNSALELSLDNVDSLLSQGERQLFCLARAILMDGKIVVLDEATSSVDARTDALMQRILRTAFADRTIIAIAHRLDTIVDFDRVVVMEGGKIAEMGEPGTLLETEGSLFRALMDAQRGA